MNNESKLTLIMNYIIEKTHVYMENGDFSFEKLDTMNISLDMDLDRANTSRLLNALWKESKVIKIQGKPVLFIDYDSIKNYFKIPFIPTTIPKTDNIIDYLNSKKIKKQNYDCFFNIIGNSDSLYSEITKAKSACAYPPSGLPILIEGDFGVPKNEFISSVCQYYFFIKKNNNINVTRVNCSNYANDSSTFISMMIGNSNDYGIDKSSIIHKSVGGILILENIDSLKSICLDNIFYIINNNCENIIMPLIIATITCKSNNLIEYEFFTKIYLNNLENIGAFEKVENIMDIFDKEAKLCKKNIVVSKDILFCFSIYVYQNNHAQLKTEIKSAIAKAYLRQIGSNCLDLVVNYSDISNEILSNKNYDRIKRIGLVNLLESIPHKLLTFNYDENSKFYDLFKQSPALYNNLRMNQFIDNFIINVDDLSDFQNYAQESISCLESCPEAQIKFIKENINNYVFQVFFSYLNKLSKLKFCSSHNYLYFGMLLHISNLIVKSKDIIPKIDFEDNKIKLNYPEEYDISYSFFNNIKQHFSISIPKKEIDFLTIFINFVENKVFHNKISILVVTHGVNIAESLVDFVNNSVDHSLSYGYINYDDNMQYNDLLELVCFKVREINIGSGVLICSDFEPLTTLHNHVLNETKIRCETITDISLYKLLSIFKKCENSSSSLDSIASNFNCDKFCYDNIMRNDSLIDNIKKKVIANTVTFIDINKACDAILFCLENITRELCISSTEELTIKFLCHCIHALERIIKKETLTYLKLSNFIRDNSEIFCVLEKNLNYFSNLYGVEIPKSEIAYICEIFLLFNISTDY